MAKPDLYTITAQRLGGYGVFSDETVTAVAKLAAKQATFTTYQEFFAAMGVGEPLLYRCADGSGVPVIDVSARTASQKGTFVIHAPMETGLDESQLYLIATLVHAFPAYRVIGFGNPSGDRLFFKEQNLTFWKRASIAFTKNQHPLVSAELEYLRTHGAKRLHQVGFSYGALKAAIESQYLPEGSVDSLVLIDPVARPRSVVRLARDFAKTYGPLGKYVNQVELETYHRARGDAAQNRNHRKALLRPINRAIGFLLARTDIFKLLAAVIERHPAASVSVAWGVASELGDDARMLAKLAPDIRQIRLKGLEHALANDIFLYAAIVRDSLE